jgi:hypothetical protein
MKNITLIAMAVAITACATHPVRCRGTLQPINAPARPAWNSKPDTATSDPAAVSVEPRQ